MADTHTIMPKKLAQALMEAGVKHFDLGGRLGVDNNFQASAPSTPQQTLQPQINQTYGHTQDVYNNQSNLAQQLMAQSQGQGPNPALAQLNQTTGQNAANQGALMASARGANQNPALVAREAAMQGGAIQQQAAGQAATLAAQQQLGAQQAAGQIYGQQGGQELQNQSIQQGALAAQNTNQTNAQLGAQGINAQVSGQNASIGAGLLGGLMQGGAAAGMAALLSKGGEVKKMADGGIMNYSTTNPFTVPNLSSMSGLAFCRNNTGHFQGFVFPAL